MVVGGFLSRVDGIVWLHLCSFSDTTHRRIITGRVGCRVVCGSFLVDAYMQALVADVFGERVVTIGAKYK